MPKKTKRKANQIKFWDAYNSFKTYASSQNLDWDFPTKRKFVKENIYPELKGKTKRFLKDVPKIAEKAIANIPQAPKEEFANPLTIPQANLSNIFWFDIDDYLETTLKAEVLPQDLLIELNAGEMGSTGIFKLSEYNYQTTRLSEIIELVRERVENESDSEWNGLPVVLPNKQDDGKATSYFIQFTVSINGEEIKPTQTPEYAQAVIEEGTVEERQQKRKGVVSKKKELTKKKKEAEKVKKIKKTPLPTQKTKPEVVDIESQKMRSDSIEKQMAYQKELLADAERLYRDKILTKKEFLAERKAILEQTSLAISKFEKGGKI
jgi:hypothetical protein